jgi:outer membrane protein assembly factor BamB
MARPAGCRSFALIAGLAAALSAAGPAPPVLADPSFTAPGWPQIRGPARDGHSPEVGLLRSWGEGAPRLLWRQPIGEGYSGIAAAGGRLFTLAAYGEEEYALGLDAATGRELWRVALGENFHEEFGNGPRATPTVDGEVVYAVGSTGRLARLLAASGEKLWEVDLTRAFGMPVPQRGYSPSPLVDGDLLVLEVGGAEGRALVALDKKTGATRWVAGEGPTGYSSPIAVTIGGVRQYVFLRRAQPEIVAVSAGGEILWTHPFPSSGISMPLFVPPDRLFFSAAHDEVGLLLRVTEAADGRFAAAEVWRHNRMRNHFNTSVVVGEHLYGFDNATLRALVAATGETKWAYRGFGKGSLVVADGLLFVLSDRGELALVEATPEAYRELGRSQALEGKSWTAPTLAGGRLYLRDQDEIACFEVKAAGARDPSPAPPAPPQGERR